MSTPSITSAFSNPANFGTTIANGLVSGAGSAFTGFAISQGLSMIVAQLTPDKTKAEFKKILDELKKIETTLKDIDVRLTSIQGKLKEIAKGQELGQAFTAVTMAWDSDIQPHLTSINTLWGQVDPPDISTYLYLIQGGLSDASKKTRGDKLGKWVDDHYSSDSPAVWVGKLFDGLTSAS